MRWPSGARRSNEDENGAGAGAADEAGFSLADLREQESRELERRGAPGMATWDYGQPMAPPAPPALAPPPVLELSPMPMPTTPTAPHASTAPSAPGPAAWQPIVVDRAIAEFEPRPPGVPLRRHVPDTVFDGWSSDSFTVRSASVRGYSHRYDGKPRQDHVTAFFQRRGSREEVLFAVADGVSNAEHGELGAVSASEAAIDALRHFLVTGIPLDWSEIVGAAVRHMTSVTRRHLKVPEPTTAQVGTLMATTLIVGAVGALPDRHRVLLARVGDSGAWILDGTTYTPVFPTKHSTDSVLVSSAVRALPHQPDPVPAAAVDLLPHQVLLVGTDGFGDPLGDGTGQVGQLFASHLAAPPPARGLAHLLDFSRETFDDDRTLLALWPRRARQEA